MKIVADRNTPHVEDAFGRLGDVIAVETSDITPRLVRDADVLLVRSEVKVDRGLLDGSSVRFVGTVTIGFDHLDTAYLDARKIRWANAPGCNANSVAEYITAALFTLAGRFGISLRGSTLGVVGVGNVGSKVVRRAEALGMKVIMNDPPLERATGYQRYRPIDELMQADIITVHVPLTRGGEDPTYHLFDDDRLRRMKSGAMLINTSRGGVVATKPLEDALAEGRLSAAVLDVWEHEPEIDVALLQRVALGTSHIAGYSLDGKMNAVRMVYNALCSFLSVDPITLPPFVLPPPDVDRIVFQANGGSDLAALAPLISSCYDIGKDDRRLRGILALPVPERGGYFLSLRREYPVRREFRATTVSLPQTHAATADLLRELGFAVDLR
jgi:erythronate-4-phosphate dehydrogenase